MAEPYRLYPDGACHTPTRRGGWAVVVVDPQGRRRLLSGREAPSTSNRMELTAAIRGLEAVPEGAEAVVCSDSEYLVRTMNGRYRRRANLDLWQRLDDLASRRRVRWEWLRGHAGHPENELANAWAQYEAGIRREPPPAGPQGSEEAPGKGAGTPTLTHLDAHGHARMVDVGGKPETVREAVARGTVRMRPETLDLLLAGGLPKGDALAVARVAGILAAKRTPELVPLCHPLPLTAVEVDLRPDPDASAVHITAAVRTAWRTGVEMEALTAVAVAALALYDMCKGVDRTLRITDIRLVRKTGGQSGDLALED